MGEMSPAQMGIWLRASPAGCTHVPKSQEHRVEVQEHPKEDEEGAEADQPQADPCGGQAETRIRAQSSPSGCGCCSGGLPIPFPPRNILSVSLQSLSTCRKALGRLLGSLKPLRAAEYRLNHKEKNKTKQKTKGKIICLSCRCSRHRERLEMLGQAARNQHLPAPARLSSCKTGAESEGRAGPIALHPLQSPPCTAGTQRGAAPTSQPGPPPCPPHHEGLRTIVPSPCPDVPKPPAPARPRGASHTPPSIPAATGCPLTLEIVESHHLAAGGGRGRPARAATLPRTPRQ